MSKMKDNLDKYNDDLKEYYSLKNKYNKQIQVIKSKILKSDIDLSAKKKMFAKREFACINCKQTGGTIFSNTKESLQAVCGNSKSPCDLNIIIKKPQAILLDSELINTDNILNQIKKDIIKTKLDFLFNYIEEDIAVELFDKLKQELTLHQDKYIELFNLYKNITDNLEEKSFIEKNIEEHNSIINEFNEFINLYYSTKENKYLKDSLMLYTSKIVKLNNDLINLKYKYNIIESDNFMNKFIQEKYTIKDLEIIKFE